MDKVTGRWMLFTHARYKFLALAALVVAMSTLTIATAQATALTTALCGIITQVQEVIFFIALALMIIGGSLYAAAHMLPAQQRGALQGYGMGMIIGGVVGVILVLVAPYVLNMILTNSAASGSGVSLANCGIFAV